MLALAADKRAMYFASFKFYFITTFLLGQVIGQVFNSYQSPRRFVWDLNMRG